MDGVQSHARAHFSRGANVLKWRAIYERYDDFFAHAVQVRRGAVFEAVRGTPGFRDGVLLDVGCGPGVLAAELLQQGHRVIGVDSSLEMARAARRALGRGNVVVADVHHLPFSDGAIANAICVGVVGYFRDAERGVREILRVLRPGGSAVLTTSNRWQLSQILDPPALVRRVATALRRRRQARGTQPQKHLIPYTAPRLARVITGSGFRIRTFRPIGFGPLAFAGRPILPLERSAKISTAIERASQVPGGRWLRHLGVFHFVHAEKPEEFLGRPTAFVLTHESDRHRTQKSLSIIGLTIARSLGRHGIPVVRVHPNRLEHGLSSRYCTAVEVCPDPVDSEEALVDFLLGLRAYGGPRVLFPASDDSADFVARHQEALRGAFELPVARREIMETIIDKRRQYARAVELGIPIPRTWFPEAGEDGRHFAGRVVGYPCVLKPLVAHRWRRREMHAATGGRKGFLAHDPDELATCYDRIRHVDPEVMVQEVVPGEDQRLFTFHSYLDARSEPLGYCIRRKIRQYPVDFGHCMITESCFDPVVLEQSLRLLRGIGYHGLSGVEWKVDPRSGEYLLIEINARAGQTIGIAAACGVDLPWIAFLDKLGRAVQPVRGFETGMKWLWLFGDLRSFFELRRRGALTFREWWRSLSGKKVHAVWARDDWRPMASFLLGALIAHRPRIAGLPRTRIPGGEV